MKKKQVLFIQGGGAGTHDEWDDKLVDSLRREIGPSYEVRFILSSGLFRCSTPPGDPLACAVRAL